jgi:hypothetical protein
MRLIVEIGNDAGLDQDTVCLVQYKPETGQNVTVKVFQQDESFTDLNIQITAGLAEEVAEGLRSQWVDGAVAAVSVIQSR